MSTAAKPSDPRIQRTLRLIGDAFVALLDERGFDQLSVRDIAERAQINRATFYLHYRDKYDLLDRTVDGMLRQFADAFRLPPGFTAAQFVKDADTPPESFVRQFEHIADNARFYKVMLGPNGLPGFSLRMDAVIRDSLFHRSMIAQPDDSQVLVPREMIVRYVSSAHLGIVMQWLENDMPYTPRYMATQLIRLHGLGPTGLVRGKL